MALYLITRTDRVGYDEYDAVVVRARNELEAASLAVNGDFQGSFRMQQFTVEKLSGAGKSGTILGSFNAG